MRISDFKTPSVSVLYHFTPYVRGTEIMQSNSLKPGTSSKNGQELANISLSRNANHVFSAYEDNIMFALSKDKLKHNYRLVLDSGDWVRLLGPSSKNPKYHEHEERVDREITNLDKYILGIGLPFDMFRTYKDGGYYELQDYADYFGIKVFQVQRTMNKNFDIVNLAQRIEEKVQLTEQMVFSSWIESLEFMNDHVMMTLLDGKQYMVGYVPEDLYDQWVQAPSQGRFWHQYIRDNYDTIRA